MTETFQIGDRVNYSIGSDVFPGVVSKVTPKTVMIRESQATLHPDWKPEFDVGGFAAHCSNQHSQHWEFSDDPNGIVRKFTYRQAPRKFMMVGSNTSVLRGGWRKFHDYNF
jgi:hypothetical protein